MRSRVRDQRGLTLPEIMVAMVILLIGVMATFVMLDVANGDESQASSREGATNLARELLEDAHAKQYTQIGPAGWFQTQLQTIGGGTGTVSSSGSLAQSNYTQSTTITRRNVTYAVSVTACSVDDGRDSYGTHASTTNWCSDSTTTGTGDGQPEDLKRVKVHESWTLGSPTGNRTQTLDQTVTFSATGAVVGPAITNLTISSPSQYANQTNPIITANPSPSPPGNVTFTATSAGAADMKFAVNGVDQASGIVNNGNGTWTFTWPIAALPDATYTIAATAIDQLGTRGQPRTLPVQLNRGTPAPLANLVGGYNYVWTNTSPYNNPPSGQKALVVELRWDANAEGSVTGYEVDRSGGSVVCGGQTSLATECIDLTPATTGSSTYTVKTWYRDANNNFQSISTTYTVTAPGNGSSVSTQWWHTTGTSVSTTKCVSPSSTTSGQQHDLVSTYTGGTEVAWTNAAGGNALIGCMPPFTSTVTMPASTNQMIFSAYLKNAGTVNCSIGVQVYKNGSILSGGVAGSGYGGSPASFVIPAGQTQPTLVTQNLSTTAQTFVAGDQLSILIAGFATNSSKNGNVCTSTTLYYNSTAHPVTTTLPLSASGGGGATLPQPAPPTGLTLTSNADGTKTLTWNAPTGTPAPDFYRIYRDGQKYTNRIDTAGDTGQAQIQWTDTNTGGTSHTYYVTTAAATLAESATMASVTG